MRWIVVALSFGIWFVFPWMFKSCTKAEYNRFSTRLHQDMRDYRSPHHEKDESNNSKNPKNFYSPR